MTENSRRTKMVRRLFFLNGWNKIASMPVAAQPDTTVQERE